MTHPVYSPQETQDPQAREEKLLAALPRFVAFAAAHSAVYRARFAGVDAAAINSRDALAALPVTAKAELVGEQEKNPPFGGYGIGDIGDIGDADGGGDAPPLLPPRKRGGLRGGGDASGGVIGGVGNVGGAMARRVYLSPGPIAECDFADADYWKTAAPLYAAGFRKGHLIHNCFSYHFTPAGMMIEDGASALGCRVFPGGVGASDMQARAAERLRCDGYAGTPDFLGVVLDKAAEIGADISSLKRAAVSGGALTPQMRKEYAARGVEVLQWFGSADLGAIAYEGVADGGMILSEGYLLEIVDPLTKKPLPPGEKGEILVTNFNDKWPLIRFSTGDLSAILPGASPCGRTNIRLAGWLGRCDASHKARGLFVHPIQIERVIAKVAELAAARLLIRRQNGRDEITLQCKLIPAAQANDNLRTKIADALREQTNLRGDISFVEEISSNDLISDLRGGG